MSTSQQTSTSTLPASTLPTSTATRPSGLPTIASYVPPTAADAPANKVSWPADPARAVLLVHDMQNHFVDVFPRGQEPLASVVPRIRQLREAATAAGIPVVFTCQPGDQDPAERALLTDFWGPGLSAAGGAPDVVAELAPTSEDTVLTKWRYSAFQRTPLRELMREWGRDQLLITGVYAHIGCQVTATEAFMDDVQAFLVADAVADFSRDDHASALSYAARRCARVLDTDQLLTELGDGSRESATETDTAGLDALRDRVAALLGEPAESIDYDDNLVDLGLDSIRLMSLVESTVAAGTTVSFAELSETPTVRSWHAVLQH